MAEFKPYKIMITTDTVGGVWTYCMELCRALQPYEVHFFLITSGDRMKDWQRKEVKALTNVEVYETDYLLEWMNNPWRDIDESAEWLERMESKLQPDLIHLNSYSYGCIPFKAPVVVVAHSDVYSWWLNVLKEDPANEWHEYFWRVKNGLNAADMVVAPSQCMLDYVQKIYSIKNNCRVIYNCRNEDLYYASKKRRLYFKHGANLGSG